nr:hypothetical protein [Tanacetum cinerariifolium]
MHIRNDPSFFLTNRTGAPQDNKLSDKELKQIKANDQAIQTILLGLPEDIYAAVDSCETAQEIWLRVQQMMKGSDIGIQEKKAKPHVTIVHQTKDFHTTDYTQLYDFLKYNQKELLIAQKKEAGIQLQAEEYDLMAAAADLDEIEEVNANCILMANLQQTSTSSTQPNSALVYDSDRSAEEKSTVSFLLEEKKRLKSDFKTCKDDLLDKHIQLEKKITELNNILLKTGQSIQTIHMLSSKPDLFYHTEQIMALGYQNPFYLKQAQKKQQSLYDGKVLLEKHDPPVVHDSEETLQLTQEIKFVGDFKSLANEADASLAKHKALELEIERLLKAVVSQDIMNIVQNAYVVDTSNLQTELEPYKDMQQKIKRLQAQLGDLKGKCKDTSCVSDTQNPLSQKLENKNVELEFRVLNYARENAHLKATYKNLFDSISVSDQKDNTQDTSKNTKFAKQPIVENLSKVGEKNALSKSVTSNLVSTPQESKGVNNDKVIVLGMFRINPFKTSREEKQVPNTVSASNRTKPITVSQPPIITKKDVNSDLNGLSSIGVDNTKTRRPQPRSNTKHDRVPSASKSSQSNPLPKLGEGIYTTKLDLPYGLYRV